MREPTAEGSGGVDTGRGAAEPPARDLEELLLELPDARVPAGWEGVQVRSIVADSRRVESGSLFVAIRGSQRDGHSFLEEAARRGATALLVEGEGGWARGIPVVGVENTRRALARLAAAWYGHPARGLRLVGITGTIGKTTVLKMLEAVLRTQGWEVGTIGSLGISIGGRESGTELTAPDPLVLHAGLRRIADAGCALAAMEVTSHALDQERVHGLSYDLGIFTNLVPLEHQAYHGSFRGYVSVKRRFLDLLRAGAPLLYSADDRAVRRLARQSAAEPVSCGRMRTADVRLEEVATAEEGSTLVAEVRRPLPRLEGGVVEPLRLELQIPLLGRSNVTNAVLSASAALVLGAEPGAIQEALRDFPPPRRRMEILTRRPFLVIDDSVGHPDSISALFEVVERLSRRRTHAVFAIRGSRGTRINRRTAEALAIWHERHPLETLVLTPSADVTDERDRVAEDERAAFLAPLRAAGIHYQEVSRLGDAVPTVLERAEENDLVVLLGAQGMDRGAGIARRWLESRTG